MERLTTKKEIYAGREVAGVSSDCCSHYIWESPGWYQGKAIDRLAAYEDTGLEPEEVEQLKLALMGKSIAEVEEFDGVPIKRLQELAKAEKAGRLVVLPCKAGEAMEAGSPWPDGDTSILACPKCGSGEWLHNPDENRNKFCGQCGQAIDWGIDNG